MGRPLKILFAASEVQPFAKTGGLADVCAALPKALARRGHDVRIVVPKYKGVDAVDGPCRLLDRTMTVPLGAERIEASLYEHRLEPGVPVHFIRHDPFFDRDHLYGPPGAAYPDNAERFIFFCRGVLETCKALAFKPDIIHCSDWQTGLIPVYLKSLYAADEYFQETRSVLSLHNLGYQGNFPKFEVFRAQLPPGLFTTDGVEFFGEFNFLKSGIMFADALTTVSRTYSREILMPEHGFRLETVLKRRQGDLHGIVNGIDTWEWNADRDPWIPQHFNAGSLEGKQACKRDLLDHFSLDLDMKTPLFGLVTRLAWQKGMDLLMQAWPSLVRDGTGVVVLGQGEPHYEAFLKEQAGSQTGVHLGFDEGLAHRILAGCDFLLMPSVYEPCGLTQMQAMRYGTVPIVHAVGGLKDTVPQFNPRTRKGLGFKFTPFGLESFQASLKNALRVYHTPPAWAHLIHNCLTADFSWDHAARRYEKVYSNTLHRDR